MFYDIPEKVQLNTLDILNVHNSSEILDLFEIIVTILYCNISYFLLYDRILYMLNFLGFVKSFFKKFVYGDTLTNFEKLKQENEKVWNEIEKEKRYNYDLERKKKENYLSVSDFILKYLLLPKQYRLKILEMVHNNLLKETLIDNEVLVNQQGFYYLCKSLVRLLTNYEKLEKESLYILYREISFVITFCRCRVYDYISHKLLEQFHNKYVVKYKHEIEQKIVVEVVNTD